MELVQYNTDWGFKCEWYRMLFVLDIDSFFYENGYANWEDCEEIREFVKATMLEF